MKRLIFCGILLSIVCLTSCGTIGGAISGMGADLDMVGGAIAGY